MKKKKKNSNLDFYNHTHHHNIIYNNKINLNIFDDHYNTPSFSNNNLNNNKVKEVDPIGSSYLVADINKTLKPNKVFQKINDKSSQKKKKYFDINSKNAYKIKINYTTLNENNDIPNNNNKSGNKEKLFSPKKRKKILIKNSFDNEDINNSTDGKINNCINNNKIKIKSEKRLINNNKKETKKNDLLKHIVKRKIIKNKSKKEISKSEEKSFNSKNSSNEDIYIYNGCDNFLIKGQYKKNDLNNVQNNDNNNNKHKIISCNNQQIKVNNISKKSIFSNNKKKKKVKVYKKKITNSSLSLSKNNKMKILEQI